MASAANTNSAKEAQISSQIDNVISGLSSHLSRAPSLIKTSYEPISLATQSSLMDKDTLANDNTTDMLSHLTLVASNSVNRFKQSGRASWYGGKFHGRKTASGERFNMHSMTAAHPSLPFNTFLKVTNKNNGKSVIVKVNDRGPFSGNRVLDLSYGAAKKIGLVSRGVANVAIERVNNP